MKTDASKRTGRRRGPRRAPDVCDQISRNAGKYVAVDRAWTRVVGVGRTWLEARDDAIRAGFPDAPVFLAARDYSRVIA